MNPFEELLSTVAGVPVLRGARCRGATTHDPAEPFESAETATARHRQALVLCGQCPALNACRMWLDGLPPSRRPVGFVVAGTIVTKTKRKESA